MKIKTGQTVYEDIMSLDADSNPVSATTFNVVTTNNGIEYTGVTVNMSLTNASIGMFLATWSANTTGDYQVYIKNNTTNVVFISDIVSVRPDSEFEEIIYIGL